VAPAILAHGDDTAIDSDRVKAILRDVEKTTTWYHDDLFGEFTGFQYYARHRYADALHYFKLGAYYADKPSQISIGLMYLKGEGVHPDAATAFAWIDLASERGYPAYVATRNHLKANLTQDELARAESVRREIALQYADVVAKSRIANELRAGLRRVTGSRAGFDSGVEFLPVEELFPSAFLGKKEATVCAHGFWAAECWQPDLYFAMRDRQLNATVTVGPVEQQK
jgi:hypothetical protein